MKKLLLSAALLCLAAPAGADEVMLRETPCRLYDSRNIGGAGLGSKISAATIESLGDAGGAQGGEAGCGVPATATGVIVNLTVLQPTSAGFARLWPAGASEPLSVALTFASAQQDEATGLMVRLGTDGEISAHLPYGTAHLIVDLAGWLEPCIPEETFDLAYNGSESSISVPETGGLDLMKYASGGAIWVGGAASQPGRYVITGSGTSLGRQRLYVSPSPETATDGGLEVHLLSGGCSPREVYLDGYTG